MTRGRIRHVLNTIYGQVFNEGQAHLLPSLVYAPYIQHNPLFPKGVEGIMGYIKEVGRIPCEVKRLQLMAISLSCTSAT